jgi:hypothetical protein
MIAGDIPSRIVAAEMSSWMFEASVYNRSDIYPTDDESSNGRTVAYIPYTILYICTCAIVHNSSMYVSLVAAQVEGILGRTIVSQGRGKYMGVLFVPLLEFHSRQHGRWFRV